MENEKNTSILKWLVVMVALGGLLMFENKLSYADIIDNEGNIVLEVNESDISFYNETFDSLLDEGYVTSEDIMVRYPLSIRKVNVKVTTEYSDYTRISDDLKTGPAGGTIVANKTITLSGGTTGNVSGISVQSGKSTSSSIGYSLNVGGNKTAYIGYRAVYRVERGL